MVNVDDLWKKYFFVRLDLLKHSHELPSSFVGSWAAARTNHKRIALLLFLILRSGYLPQTNTNPQNGRMDCLKVTAPLKGLYGVRC